ncbi:hypothetical protein [Actinacidiphila alni]|uniref:hypothetical protein n=1 Tax=Actinacidiphila alni TaxID=380248 RepID=UPI003454A0A5
MRISPTPPPADSHGHALAARRRAVFTGRVAELRLLRELMLSERRACFVVWLHGMGGFGKSSLLHRFADEAAAHGRAVRTVDMRVTDATPEAFLAALAAQGPPEEAQLLLIDSGEALGGLEQWLRDEFLPRTPSQLLVVVGSRRPPAAEWRADAQWWQALRRVELRDLDTAEATRLLRKRDVPEAAVPGILRAAHGVPLALALFADARGAEPEAAAWEAAGPEAAGSEAAGSEAAGPEAAGSPGAAWELADSPDLVRELLHLLLRETPTAGRAGALHVLALARATTEDLLRHALEVPPDRAGELCGWLRGQSFVRSTADGLVPHELVREALLADLRWRDPSAYERLFVRLHTHLTEQAAGRTGSRWAYGAGLAHLGRSGRVALPAVDWRGTDRLRSRAARPEDLPEVLAAIGREHGAAARALARQWWDRQPAAFVVTEDGRRGITGVLVAPCLGPAAAGPPEDPVARAALAHTAGRWPLRRTERLLLARWSTGDAVATAGALTTLWATTPGLAVSWTCAAPDRPGLAALLDLYGQQRVAPGGTTADGGGTDGQEPYGEGPLCFVQDWRGLPFDRWAAALRARLLADEPVPGPAPADAAAEAAMPWPEFADAVKHAYRSLQDGRELAGSVLLGTRLVTPDADAAALRRVLTETVVHLRSQPEQRQLGTILEITYLSGPRSQQAAASRAGLSFSTYRRRLSTALTTAAEVLRERERYGPVPR